MCVVDGLEVDVGALTSSTFEPGSSRSSPAEVSLFVCGFAPGPRASFPGISSFRKRGRAGRCKVDTLRKQN